jgi:hypothetical protein
MKRSAYVILCAVTTAIFLSWNPLLTGPLPLGPSASLAQEEWRSEFDAACSKTDVTMTLSTEELKELIAGCDRLKPKIEAQEESTQKVYLRRLQMCRELYKYLLETKEAK